MQKYHKGDLVRVDKDLGAGMEHFDGPGEEAIVLYSYADKYRDPDDERTTEQEQYALYFKEHGSISWYDEDQLNFIASAQHVTYEEWRAYRKAKRAAK